MAAVIPEAIRQEQQQESLHEIVHLVFDAQHELNDHDWYLQHLQTYDRALVLGVEAMARRHPESTEGTLHYPGQPKIELAGTSAYDNWRDVSGDVNFNIGLQVTLPLGERALKLALTRKESSPAVAAEASRHIVNLSIVAGRRMTRSLSIFRDPEQQGGEAWDVRGSIGTPGQASVSWNANAVDETDSLESTFYRHAWTIGYDYRRFGFRGVVAHELLSMGFDFCTAVGLEA